MKLLRHGSLGYESLYILSIHVLLLLLLRE